MIFTCKVKNFSPNIYSHCIKQINSTKCGCMERLLEPKITKTMTPLSVKRAPVLKVLTSGVVQNALKIIILHNLLFSVVFPQSQSETQETEEFGLFGEESYLDWEDVELNFLTNLKGPHLHSNDFHVVKAMFPARQISFMIHLTKTQGLFHASRLELLEEEVESLGCYFSGTIHESNVSLDPTVTPKNGRVSFSSCHHESAFVRRLDQMEGLILLPNEQYYIRPHFSDDAHPRRKVKIKKRSLLTPTKVTIPHKAHKVNSQTFNGTHKIDEILHVPPEELQKALDESASKQNSDTYADSHAGKTALRNASTVSENDLRDVEEDGELSGSETSSNDCIEGSSCKSLPPVIATLVSSRKGKKAKKGWNKPVKKSLVDSSSTNGMRVVEIAVFTDEKLYQVWQSRYPKDTSSKMNQYVLAVINNMNALYQHPTMTESVTFRLVHLEIESKKPKNLNDHKGAANKYLKSFCAYAKEKNQFNNLWDHALMLTGHDLKDGGSTSTAGIAWFGTMCINGFSCSLIEGSTFGSTFITSHEIGHSLGMEHDGSGGNSNCDENSYIMSPTTGGGKSDWSKCSISNMKNFLNRGYGGTPAPKCISKKGSKAAASIKFNSNKLPGEQFNANEQCSAECKGCTPYATVSPPYNDICHQLFCRTKGDVRGFTIWSTHPALEGTSCGRGKRCVHGKCK